MPTLIKAIAISNWMHLNHSSRAFKSAKVVLLRRLYPKVSFQFAEQKRPHGGIPRVNDDHDGESDQDGRDQLEEVDVDIVGELVDGRQRRLVEPDGDEDEAEVDGQDHQVRLRVGQRVLGDGLDDLALPREVRLVGVFDRHSVGPLEVLDLDLDEDIEEDAEDLELALEAVGQRGEVLRQDVGAGVVDDRHLSIEGQLGQVEDVGEAFDPEGDEAVPEVVIDSGRIFQPEDEDISDEEIV